MSTLQALSDLYDSIDSKTWPELSLLLAKLLARYQHTAANWARRVADDELARDLTWRLVHPRE